VIFVTSLGLGILEEGFFNLKKPTATFETSVADPDLNPDPNPDPDPPDPHVSGPPGSGSGSISNRYGSGSGSFYKQK
jgi:hypothetical protein